MTDEASHNAPAGSGTSGASVMDRGGDSVTPMGGTEPGHARRPDTATGPAAAGDEWPGKPDETWFDDPDAWFDDPDAHFEDVIDYMKRLHIRCESSDEFVAALSSLFPDLEEKVARVRAGEEVDFGADGSDPDAEIAGGPFVRYRSTAELVAANLAKIADPVVLGEPDEAWFDDPDAHFEDVIDYMKRLHIRCESSDEFVAALSGLFPDLEEKVAKERALAAEDFGNDEPDPETDIAAGRCVRYLSGAEMLAADLAYELEPRCV